MSAEQVQVLFRKALAFHQRKQLAQASELYRAVLRVRPVHFDALHLSGVIAYQTKDLAAAVELIGKAIEIDPDNAAPHNNLGLVLHELRRFEGALASYERAIALKPDYAEAWSNRGNTLRGLGRLEAALGSYERAIALKPDYARALANRGNLLRELGQVDAAVDSCDRAIAANPALGQAHFNKSLALLLGGDFAKGWELYEWRWADEEKILERRRFEQPLWLGKESLAGRTILLHAEQGLGDTIQFCRYAPLVAEMGARVVMEVQKPLASLLGQVPGIAELIVKGSPLPSFDYQCPFLSLPLALKAELHSIPRSPRYLHADQRKLVRWASRLGESDRPRIGLAWSGSPRHQNDRKRSLRLADLLPFLPAGCQYVSLQKEVRDVDRPILASSANILDFSAEIDDFADTAALCELMDLVISVDTSVAHLAGALGRPTWVLLPFVPDWRWLLDRNDSPWYPSIRLYRQKGIGDWASVFHGLQGDLTSLYGRFRRELPVGGDLTEGGMEN